MVDEVSVEKVRKICNPQLFEGHISSGLVNQRLNELAEAARMFARVNGNEKKIDRA